MRIVSTILAGICFAFPLACGASPPSESSSGPPIDFWKKLSALSTAEVQALCDWSTQKEGGYGRTIQCEASGTPLETALDQATCVAESSQNASQPNCSVTLGQWTTCFQWFLAHWCSATTLMLPAAYAVREGWGLTIAAGRVRRCTFNSPSGWSPDSAGAENRCDRPAHAARLRPSSSRAQATDRGAEWRRPPFGSR